MTVFERIAEAQTAAADCVERAADATQRYSEHFKLLAAAIRNGNLAGIALSSALLMQAGGEFAELYAEVRAKVIAYSKGAI